MNQLMWNIQYYETRTGKKVKEVSMTTDYYNYITSTILNKNLFPLALGVPFSINDEQKEECEFIV